MQSSRRGEGLQCLACQIFQLGDRQIHVKSWHVTCDVERNSPQSPPTRQLKSLAILRRILPSQRRFDWVPGPSRSKLLVTILRGVGILLSKKIDPLSRKPSETQAEIRVFTSVDGLPLGVKELQILKR